MNGMERLSTYVDRLTNDDEIHGHIKKTASAGGSAMRRVRKRGAKKAAKDAKARRQVLTALVSARRAVEKLNQPKEKKSGRWLRRLFLLSLLGFGAYLAANEEARKRLMDAIGPDGSPIDAPGPADSHVRPPNPIESDKP